MIAVQDRTETADNLSESARRRFLQQEQKGPVLLGDWCEAVFIHYVIAPEVLQPFVPVELDVWEGRAYVSLVAFTMRRFRPARGGRLTEMAARPFATQQFLNLRAYVRHGGERGIHFITEWNSSRLCAWTAPWIYGLPYRLATLDYRHEAGMQRGSGIIRGASGRCEFDYTCDTSPWSVASPGLLDEFLLERYVATAAESGRLRYFRVWHLPWKKRRVAEFQADDALLRQAHGWWKHAKFVAAHVSPGTNDVWMGPPRAALR